ncbi:hypothetical protein SLEP1_g12400 [Rubroshorea leprosula]|uniref:Large ribosomal subunit protein bL32m n=2 Tax=Rubroshorea leprosula TaxID=152421 RepID=A0AAV5ICD8_9ROSI|nr:hypothetical protein SLEP1_g12400 [Rubroshorea leprosula]
MALRVVMLKHVEVSSGPILGLRRLAHSAALPLQLDYPIGQPTTPQPFVLPEMEGMPNKNNKNDNGLGFPSFSFSGSMELMTEPKRKTTPHKRGIRNGPKALKPVPVIIRCKSCGRVKLPHFYCCSGERGATGERSGSGSSN